MDFKFEKNKTYLGDCLELMPQMESGMFNMILCDLPYGTTACKWDTIIPFDKLWEQYERLIKPNGAIVLTASQPFTSALVMSNPKLFKYEWIWKKNKPSGMFNANRQPMNNHESVLVFYKILPTYNKTLEPRECNEASKNRLKYKMAGFSGSNTYGKTTTQKKQYDAELRNPTTVKEFSQTPNPLRKHPNEKPISMLEYFIKTYTNEGDLVLDNCAGSGTTGIACLNTNRNYIQIEKENNYFDLILEREKSFNEANKK
jgi:site-specific DNA-methyltransferase (adenine-specific)